MKRDETRTSELERVTKIVWNYSKRLRRVVFSMKGVARTHFGLRETVDRARPRLDVEQRKALRELKCCPQRRPLCCSHCCNPGTVFNNWCRCCVLRWRRRHVPIDRCRCSVHCRRKRHVLIDGCRTSIPNRRKRERLNDSAGAASTANTSAMYSSPGASAARPTSAGVMYSKTGAGAASPTDSSEMYSTTGANAALTASIDAMYSSTGAKVT